MNRQKGFTLVEAAVAIGVVAILSGIIIPLILKNLRDAQEARARNDLQVIAAAIASQLKDTGGRPRAGGGPGGATGQGDALWFSAGVPPRNGAAGAGGAALVPGVQTFENLFAAGQTAQGNALFGLAGPRGRELTYKGPYLGTDMARKTDPWGGAYVILGYNANGQTHRGPIWVASAGASRAINTVNLTVGAAAAGPLAPGAAAPHQYRSAWDYSADSASNLALRVN